MKDLSDELATAVLKTFTGDRTSGEANENKLKSSLTKAKGISISSATFGGNSEQSYKHFLMKIAKNVIERSNYHFAICTIRWDVGRRRVPDYKENEQRHHFKQVPLTSQMRIAHPVRSAFI